jgi:putative membrane protein
MRSRNTFGFIKLFLKGVFMGIADAMPGISGGTIALLVGIYEELIKSISGLKISLFSELKNNGFNSFWKKLNGNFLLVLSLGIGISLISFVKISAFLLEKYPLFIWSFFLGLIFATIYVIYKMINQWSIINFFFLIISIIISVLFSLYNSSFLISETTEISLLYILISGMIASSAMILPGISGSLILVILGVYAYLIKSLDNLEFIVIFTFVLGAIIGLLGFSRILKYLFNNQRDVTYTFMLGLVIGSILTVWFEMESVSTELSKLNLLLSVSLVILGFIIVFLLEKTKNIK